MNTSPSPYVAGPATIFAAAPAVALSEIAGIPVEGSGLSGAAYVPGTSIWNIAKVKEAMAAPPDLTFTSTELAYGSRHSDTTVAGFLDRDAASIVGDGDAYEMGPSALSFHGYVYIPAGVHEITVVSDDGFELSLGDEVFSAHEGTRAPDGTARVADFEGGLYKLDLLYFDAGGGMALNLRIDGVPVDQSAFYQSVEDFQNPPADVPLVPVADYHPGYFLGEDSLDIPVDGTGTEARDVIAGKGADDTLTGLGGDDHITGGYGDDILRGGDGDDVLDGGRGSDILDGGAGDDLLVARSDAGITRIGQYAIGIPTRDDPDNEVNDALQILKGYEGQPIVGDDVLIGGEGRDTFLISPQISAKLGIIEEHVRHDGSINWAGVAGENDEVHDHWVDSFGIDIIADYNRDDDHIAIIGHTAKVYVEHRDVIGDEALESIITVISNQHGGGGAHDMDLIGQVIVHGDLVEKEDIQTDANVTYGIVDGYQDVAEALAPLGEEKVTTIDGVDYKGYDTRTPSPGATKATNNGMGTENTGAVTGNPGLAFDNANFTEDMLAAPDDPGEAFTPTRAPFEQLGVVERDGVRIWGDNTSETMVGAGGSDASGLPGAIGYWSFADGRDGAFSDARGEGPAIKAYTLHENQALLRPNGLTDGPAGDALYFNGETDFAFLQHDASHQFTQGTVAMWVRPDDLTDKSMFVTKDHSGSGNGGHFRFGHTDEGGLFLRMAPGDGGSNKAWETGPDLLQEGAWQHVAVSFTAGGVEVYLDGNPVPASAWTPVEGDVPAPNVYTEAFFLRNEEPWVFGADTYKTDLNGTAQEFATDDEDLRNPFEGGIADFGLWGGYTPEDALSAVQIRDLMLNGPGEALTNPSGPQAMEAIHDRMYGMGGHDTMDGGAGDDTMLGHSGDDLILGGYGDDYLLGNVGNDTLDGGRGSDLLEGGDGDDVLISRSDAGEDRIGQLVIGERTRPDEPGTVDEEYLKLIDWVDQPLVGDDVLVGGAGRDHFRFETLINGKLDALTDNLKEDGRTINWHGVAGENTYTHDHWVDSIGIDVIADYDADEDTISVIGHTTQVKVDYRSVDTDGDGIADDAVSIITAYSQQGKGGGAHDEDYLGYIVVHGDRVELDDIITDAGAHFGVVDTIDEAQEALAPTGDTKWSEIDGRMHLGYDTRDIDGDPMGVDPEAFSSNAWLNGGLVDMARAVDGETGAPELVSFDAGGDFNGLTAMEIPHTPGMELTEGTVAFSFTADDPEKGVDQMLWSKDHSGYKDGGHLTFYLSGSGTLKARFQSDEETRYLHMSGEKIEAGETYNVAFTFDPDETALYVNGELADRDDGFADGMRFNTEDILIGASSTSRNGDNDNPRNFFEGSVQNASIFGRPLSDAEVLFLAEGGSDPDAIDVLHGGDPMAGPDAPPAVDPPVEEPPVAEEPPAPEQPPADQPPVTEPPAEDGPTDEEYQQYIGSLQTYIDELTSIIQELMSYLMAFLGLGPMPQEPDDAPVPDDTGAPIATNRAVSLADIVPVAGSVDEDAMYEEEEPEAGESLAA